MDRGAVLRCYDDEDLVLPCKLRKALLTSLSIDTGRIFVFLVELYNCIV